MVDASTDKRVIAAASCSRMPHRRLARRLIAVRWRTALVVPEGERIAVGDRLAPQEAEKQTIPVSTRRVIPDIAARLRDDLVGRREHNLLVTALELLQERGETFRDSLLDGTVLGPKPYPDCPQPWASGQDVTRFGLARPMLPVLAATDS